MWKCLSPSSNCISDAPNLHLLMFPNVSLCFLFLKESSLKLATIQFDEAPLPYSITQLKNRNFLSNFSQGGFFITMNNSIYCCYFTLHQYPNIILVNGMSQIQNMYKKCNHYNQSILDGLVQLFQHCTLHLSHYW